MVHDRTAIDFQSCDSVCVIHQETNPFHTPVCSLAGEHGHEPEHEHERERERERVANRLQFIVTHCHDIVKRIFM